MGGRGERRERRGGGEEGEEEEGRMEEEVRGAERGGEREHDENSCNQSARPHHTRPPRDTHLQMHGAMHEATLWISENDLPSPDNIYLIKSET